MSRFRMTRPSPRSATPSIVGSTDASRSAVRSPRRAPRQRAFAAPPDRDGRDKILQVAIRSFSEIGYEGTTTAAVAREAGVTQPLVHHHFGSKEGLWRAAMDELFAEVDAFREPSDASPTERLVAGIDQFVRFVARRPEVTRVIAREGAKSSPRLTYLIDRHLRAPFQAVVGAMKAGQRAGLIARDVRPELVLFLLLGAGSHLFDVTAFARESLGIDAESERTREEFVALVREVMSAGIFRERVGKRRR